MPQSALVHKKSMSSYLHGRTSLWKLSAAVGQAASQEVSSCQELGATSKKPSELSEERQTFYSVALLESGSIYFIENG